MAVQVAISISGSVFGGHGMGTESVMRNLATLNQLWDGATLPVERRSSESFTVRGARLTMAVQVQESTIRAFFANTKGWHVAPAFWHGFWCRARRQHKVPATSQKPQQIGLHWLRSMNGSLEILNQPAPIDTDGALTPAMLTRHQIYGSLGGVSTMTLNPS